MDGEESTGVFVLQRLARDRDDVKLLLRYRELQKLVGSFYDSYKELNYKGKLYTNFHITKTRTGRLSSSNPNVQQIPDAVQPLFVPKSKDHVFINYDLSAIEARLIAAESGDATLCDLIRRGLSIHDQSAKIFFNLKCSVECVKGLYPIERQVAKTAGFSIFYGAGKNRLKTTFVANNVHKTDEEITQILRDFKSTYKGSFKRHREITEQIEQGEQLYNIFGRPIIIENVEDAYMKGLNSLIQSGASDLNLIAAMRAQEQYKKLNLDANVLCLVHDSILIESHRDCVKKAEQILIYEMTKKKLTNDVSGVSISIACEGKISNKWE